jgi:hypothetical protein
LGVAFAIPSKPSTSGYRVHIETYRNETDAHRAYHRLEQLDHYMIDHVFFNVEPQHAAPQYIIIWYRRHCPKII